MQTDGWMVGVGRLVGKQAGRQACAIAETDGCQLELQLAGRQEDRPWFLLHIAS